MSEFALELVFGLAVLGIILALNLPKGKLKVSLRVPNLSFSRKEVEKKIEEIDRKLDEVVSSGVKERVVKLDDATQEIAKRFEVKEDILSEMQSGEVEKGEDNSEKRGEENFEKIPEISLPSLNELEKMEKEVKIEGDAVKDEKVEKVEFEESDKLLEDLAKEVEKREEEQIDLLRELKGQKFEIKELEKELSEVLERMKRLKA
uniref:Uncharacterized protein n=1 Tax=Archaeoglobus fulgidus TaxID=2234 RepID=A0A7J2TLM1_ARCFL